jgi:predicted nucleic acid-binding protein
MMTTSTVLELILDASVLINFLTIDRIDLLQHLPGHHFVITAHVAGEITYPDQARRLATAIHAGALHMLPVGSHAELVTFARLTTTLGIGESAAIAAAQHRSMLVAVEDRTARRRAESLVGKQNVLSTVDLMLRAIQAGLVTIADADAIKAD